MIKALDQYDGLDITMQVTEDCNLACKYCYEVNKKPTTLPFEYAQKFIDLILTEEDPADLKNVDMDYLLHQGLIIDFIGGDALMVPELCDKILTYFQYKAYELNHRWKDRWRCSISTNGTLLHKPEVQKFLEKYKGNISLGISIDGCPEIHDKNRVTKNGEGSFKYIKDNWDFYMDYMGEFANTKATLNKESIPYIYQSVKYLHEELKLRHINMNFIFEPMYLNIKDLALLDHQLEKTVEYIYNHRDDLYVNMFDQDRAIGKAMTEVSKKTTHCGAGAMPCLTVNGKIYPCFRFVPNTMHSESLDFNVGNIWEGFINKERFNIVKSQYRCDISETKCLECNVESACAWCIGGAYSETGKFYRTTNICEITKLNVEHPGIFNSYQIIEYTLNKINKGVVLKYEEITVVNGIPETLIQSSYFSDVEELIVDPNWEEKPVDFDIANPITWENLSWDDIPKVTNPEKLYVSNILENPENIEMQLLNKLIADRKIPGGGTFQ